MLLNRKKNGEILNYKYHIPTLIILIARIEPFKVFHNKNHCMKNDIP